MSGFLDFLLPAAAVAGTALTAGAAAPAAAGALAAGEAATAAIPTALAADAALTGGAALAPAAATAAEVAPVAAAAPAIDATTAAMTANQGLTGIGGMQGTAGVPQGFAQMLSPTAPTAQTGALTPGLQVQGLNSVAIPETGGVAPNLAPSVQSMTPPAPVAKPAQSLTPQQLNSINQLMNNDGQKPPPQPGAPAAPQGRALPNLQLVGAPQYATPQRGGLASILTPRR